MYWKNMEKRGISNRVINKNLKDECSLLPFTTAYYIAKKNEKIEVFGL